MPLPSIDHARAQPAIETSSTKVEPEKPVDAADGLNPEPANAKEEVAASDVLEPATPTEPAPPKPPTVDDAF